MDQRELEDGNQGGDYLNAQDWLDATDKLNLTMWGRKRQRRKMG